MQMTDLVAQLLAQPLIKPGQRFVKQENRRFQDECTGKSNALPLPRGKLVNPAPLETFEGNDSKHVRCALPPRRRVYSAYLKAIGDVLRDGHVRKQAEVQEDVGNNRLVVDLGRPIENYGGGKVHSASSFVGRTETVESG